MVSALTSMFGGQVDELLFKMKAGPHDETKLVVAGFSGHEALSHLFRWDVDVVIDPEATPTLDDTLGLDAEFQILRDNEVIRVVRGIVGEVAPRASGERQRLVTLTIVPKLAELQYTSDYRIFQDLPVHDIVAELVKPHNIELEWRVDRRPQTRPYRVQRDETDYEFFCRIVADAGIHFHFFADQEKTKLVLVNNPGGYTPIDGEPGLPYRETGGAVTVDHVGSISCVRGLRPGAVVMRDYDFKRSRADLTARGEVEGPHNDEMAPKRELFLFPGDYTDAAEEGKTLAARRLQESRADARLFHGNSSCVRLQVGRKFELEQHPDDSWNQELVITELRLRGQRSGILAETVEGGSGPGFTAAFECAPSKARLQPARPRTPYAPPEPARVVGPEKGTPFVDEFGRVKVQFFWDREGKWDEKSSCWLRVMTPAAAADRGIWFPPRVGDEVVVNYFNGDIDRPFVAGAIYNAQEPQPNALPADASKSTIKTLTIPGGKGFNELTFQDRAGQEEIFLHAQKDRKTVVLHNHSETVGANQTSTVGANQTISVGANRTLSVGANESTSIGAHRHESVGKGEDVTIKQGRTHTIETGDDKLVVTAGNRDVNVKLKDTHHAKSKVETIDTTYELKGGTSITIHHPGDSKIFMEAGKASISTTSEIVLSNPSGSITLANGKVEIVAKSEVLIGSGKSTISIKNDGSIGLTGAKEIQAASGTSFMKVEPAKATLSGPMADVVAKAIAKVVGALVKIN
ncbi:type VI secretion system tip protein VgrG [Pendulispora rubella]|uniref:Type VI secretion system tip protein VgrG n=1 Tax=Pendulispora rubella TaxID=2741070 RepID=A0ABZ2LJM2_9BACT